MIGKTKKTESRTLTHTQARTHTIQAKSYWSCVSMKKYSFNWRLDESGNNVKIALIRITNHFCVVKKCTSIQLCILNAVITFPLIFSFFLHVLLFFCDEQPQSQCHGINGIHKTSQLYGFDLEKKIVDWCSFFSLFFSRIQYTFAYEFLLKHTETNQKMHPKMKSYTFVCSLIIIIYVRNFMKWCQRRRFYVGTNMLQRT